MVLIRGNKGTLDLSRVSRCEGRHVYQHISALLVPLFASCVEVSVDEEQLEWFARASRFLHCAAVLSISAKFLHRGPRACDLVGCSRHVSRSTARGL